MLESFLRAVGKVLYRHRLAVSIIGTGFLVYVCVRVGQMWATNMHAQSFPVAGSWGLLAFGTCAAAVYIAVVKLQEAGNGMVLHMWIPCILGWFAAAMALTASMANPTDSERVHDMWAVTGVIGLTMLLQMGVLLRLARRTRRKVAT